MWTARFFASSTPVSPHFYVVGVVSVGVVVIATVVVAFLKYAGGEMNVGVSLYRW